MNGDDDAVPLLRRRRELYDSDSDSDGDDDDVSDVDNRHVWGGVSPQLQRRVRNENDMDYDVDDEDDNNVSKMQSTVNKKLNNLISQFFHLRI